MNNNLDLVEILKDCKPGTILYSPLFGEVTFKYIRENYVFSIVLSHSNNNGNITSVCFTKNGKYVDSDNGECLLFPSKEQRDWSKFKVNKPKFDPKTLQPFDRILTIHKHIWVGRIVSHIEKDMIFVTSGGFYDYCVPYNDDTKHLIGTTDEAPEYYRYWEK